jgi:crotonobetainyl-CoA:carnitine CoA-transferase CaiB-like acyl-CoA transferase
MEPSSPGALGGLRVVDCSQGVAGIRTTALLADYGAEVVWVEPPGGDPYRQVDPVAYAVFCRGKRSVTLDLEQPDDVRTLLDLLAGADVVVENRTALAEKMGFGYAAVHERHPGLVYASISAFGRTGPHRALPPYEGLIHAVVGTMAEQVGFRTGPIYEAVPFASVGAAYLAQIGILSALYRRREDGIGRLVETSLLDGALAYLSMMWGEAETEPQAEPDRGHGRLVVRSFRCSDDTYLGVHTGAAGAFSRLMQAVGLDDRVPPVPGRDVGTPLSEDEYQIIEHVLPAIFAAEPRATWIDRLVKADVCAIPVLYPTEVFDEPQTVHNHMVVEVDDRVIGRTEQVGPALRFRSSPPPVLQSAPGPGTTSRSQKLFKSTPPFGGAARAAGSSSPRPLLDGLRVLDFGVWYASAYSSRMLADLGADVIKVEPVTGDQIRGIRRPFMSAHARKRSLAINLKDPELRPAVNGLLRWANIIHHNMRPGAAEKLGIGYEQAKAVNPDIVYVYAPGWGSSGPQMARQSFAPLVSGYVGASYEAGGQFNPPAYPVGNEDPGSGMLGAVGMLTALLRGHGEYIENPQLNAAMVHVAHIVRGPDGPIGAGRLDALQRRIGPFDGLYQTSDSWICIAAFTQPEISALAGALGFAGDDRFSTHAGGSEGYELSLLIEEALARRTTDEWLDVLRASGVAAVRPVTEHNAQRFLTQVENVESGRVGEVGDEEFGSIRQVDHLIRISDDIPVPLRGAPRLGQHTREILEQLGYDAPTLAVLAHRGSITLGSDVVTGRRR